MTVVEFSFSNVTCIYLKLPPTLFSSQYKSTFFTDTEFPAGTDTIIRISFCAANSYLMKKNNNKGKFAPKAILRIFQYFQVCHVQMHWCILAFAESIGSKFWNLKFFTCLPAAYIASTFPVKILLCNDICIKGKTGACGSFFEHNNIMYNSGF